MAPTSAASAADALLPIVSSNASAAAPSTGKKRKAGGSAQDVNQGTGQEEKRKKRKKADQIVKGGDGGEAAPDQDRQNNALLPEDAVAVPKPKRRRKEPGSPSRGTSSQLKPQTTLSGTLAVPSSNDPVPVFASSIQSRSHEDPNKGWLELNTPAHSGPSMTVPGITSALNTAQSETSWRESEDERRRRIMSIPPIEKIFEAATMLDRLISAQETPPTPLAPTSNGVLLTRTSAPAKEVAEPAPATTERSEGKRKIREGKRKERTSEIAVDIDANDAVKALPPTTLADHDRIDIARNSTPAAAELETKKRKRSKKAKGKDKLIENIDRTAEEHQPSVNQENVSLEQNPPTIGDISSARQKPDESTSNRKRKKKKRKGQASEGGETPRNVPTRTGTPSLSEAPPAEVVLTPDQSGTPKAKERRRKRKRERKVEDADQGEQAQSRPEDEGTKQAGQEHAGEGVTAGGKKQRKKKKQAEKEAILVAGGDLGHPEPVTVSSPRKKRRTALRPSPESEAPSSAIETGASSAKKNQRKKRRKAKRSAGRTAEEVTKAKANNTEVAEEVVEGPALLQPPPDEEVGVVDSEKVVSAKSRNEVAPTPTGDERGAEAISTVANLQPSFFTAIHSTIDKVLLQPPPSPTELLRDFWQNYPDSDWDAEESDVIEDADDVAPRVESRLEVEEREVVEEPSDIARSDQADNRISITTPRARASVQLAIRSAERSAPVTIEESRASKATQIPRSPSLPSKTAVGQPSRAAEAIIPQTQSASLQGTLRDRLERLPKLPRLSSGRPPFPIDLPTPISGTSAPVSATSSETSSDSGDSDDDDNEEDRNAKGTDTSASPVPTIPALKEDVVRREETEEEEGDDESIHTDEETESELEPDTPVQIPVAPILPAPQPTLPSLFPALAQPAPSVTAPSPAPPVPPVLGKSKSLPRRSLAEVLKAAEQEEDEEDEEEEDETESHLSSVTDLLDEEVPRTSRFDRRRESSASGEGASDADLQSTSEDEEMEATPAPPPSGIPQAHAGSAPEDDDATSSEQPAASAPEEPPEQDMTVPAETEEDDGEVEKPPEAAESTSRNEVPADDEQVEAPQEVVEPSADHADRDDQNEAKAPEPSDAKSAAPTEQGEDKVPATSSEEGLINTSLDALATSAAERLPAPITFDALPIPSSTFVGDEGVAAVQEAMQLDDTGAYTSEANISNAAKNDLSRGEEGGHETTVKNNDSRGEGDGPPLGSPRVTVLPDATLTSPSQAAPAPGSSEPVTAKDANVEGMAQQSEPAEKDPKVPAQVSTNGVHEEALDVTSTSVPGQGEVGTEPSVDATPVDPPVEQPPEEPVRPARGRPKRAVTRARSQSSQSPEATLATPAKRGRGRPRKVPVTPIVETPPVPPSTDQSQPTVVDDGSHLDASKDGAKDDGVLEMLPPSQPVEEIPSGVVGQVDPAILAATMQDSQTRDEVIEGAATGVTREGDMGVDIDTAPPPSESQETGLLPTHPTETSVVQKDADNMVQLNGSHDQGGDSNASAGSAMDVDADGSYSQVTTPFLPNNTLFLPDSESQASQAARVFGPSKTVSSSQVTDATDQTEEIDELLSQSQPSVQVDTRSQVALGEDSSKTAEASPQSDGADETSSSDEVQNEMTGSHSPPRASSVNLPPPSSSFPAPTPGLTPTTSSLPSRVNGISAAAKWQMGGGLNRPFLTPNLKNGLFSRTPSASKLNPNFPSLDKVWTEMFTKSSTKNPSSSSRSASQSGSISNNRNGFGRKMSFTRTGSNTQSARNRDGVEDEEEEDEDDEDEDDEDEDAGDEGDGAGKTPKPKRGVVLPPEKLAGAMARSRTKKSKGLGDLWG